MFISNLKIEMEDVGYFKVIWSLFVTQVLFSSYIGFIQPPLLVRTLTDQASRRIATGLRPRTSTAYTATLKLFLAIMVYEVVTSKL